MSFSPNSAQSRELTELRNHLKWLDEERRKTARKLGEMEQRIAQQGRDLTEREKRIHELEWQLAQFAERIEQMPEAGTGASGQEQRLQDLEWHMSNINAQLVRLPKLDEELARFREDLSQHTVDIENRLMAQQAEDAQRLETNVYARLNEDIVQSTAAYDARLVATQNEILDRVSVAEAGIHEGLEARLLALAVMQEEFTGRLDRLETIDTSDPEIVENLKAIAVANEQRIAELVESLDAAVVANEQRIAELAANFDGAEAGNDQRIAALSATIAATQAHQEQFESNFESNIESRLGKLLEDQAQQLREELKVDDNYSAAITRIDQEMELRQSEELRLSNLIGVQEGKLERAYALIEEMNRVVAGMQTKVADTDVALQELRGSFEELDANWKPALMEASGKIMPLSERLNALSNAVTKSEANLQTLASDQTEMRDSLTGVSDELRQTRTDLTSQVDNWQQVIDEHKETIERFSQQWLTLSNQYKEARMAVQNFAHWQKQLEQQKREASEMLRVESNRMQSRWEGFLLEIQEQMKNVDLDLAQKWQAFELENEQRWIAARRNEQLWREELASVDELIVKLQQDSRNLIWRVQAAQADAIKKWPRLLLEEVEKAVELNPNRRLQPTTGTVARTDMSVADAIEQGLIKVDYDDEMSADNP